MRSSRSLGRLPLWCVLLAAAVFATFSFGQDGGAPATKPHRGVGTLIMENRDFVFFTIIGCSVIALALIIQGFLKIRASVLIPEETNARLREFIANKQFKELIDYTENDPSFVSQAINPAIKRAPVFANMKEAMETAVSEQTAEQFRKIEYLNIIGNLGPLLGLLGTVLGMINAFNVLHEHGGEVHAKQLAGGISQALTHTMLGLMLAIPCIAAFGVLRTMVDRVTMRGAMIAEELLLMMKPSEAKPAAAAASRPPAPQPMRKAPAANPAE